MNTEKAKKPLSTKSRNVFHKFPCISFPIVLYLLSQSMKLCEKTTDFRVNLCCFSTVGISGLQPHAQLRSIYILRLCMRLFCPHTFLMPHVYRHNREHPTSIYSSKYRCSAVIIIVLYGSITLSGGIPRSTAQKRINKKASPRSRYPYSG